MNTTKFIIVLSIVLIATNLIYPQVNGLDITVNFDGKDKVISIPNGCVEYSDNFLDHAEVTVKKSWTWAGDTVECNWRPFVDYFMQRNYIVTFDGSTAVFMRGPPIIADTGDSSSDNQRSEAGSEILENKDETADEYTGNNSAFEEYVKKYCPEYSDPDEHQLLVLCDYPELDEPEDTPPPQPPQD